MANVNQNWVSGVFEIAEEECGLFEGRRNNQKKNKDYEKSEEGVDENRHGRIFLHQLLDSCLGADRIKECFNVTFVLCFDIIMLHISLCARSHFLHNMHNVD